MQTKSTDGRAVIAQVALRARASRWLLGWLLACALAPAVVAAQAGESGQTEADAPATPQPTGSAPQQDAAFMPSEPLGATAQREQVDSEPPDGFDLSRFPDRVDRSGFTMELGIGLALTHISFDLPDDVAFGLARETEFGLAPPSLSLGGFLTSDLALMFRMAGTSWFSERLPGESIMLHSTFLGGAIQYWPSDDLFLGAGIGLGVFDNYLFAEDIESDTGLMFTGRVGYSFYHAGIHSLALVGEFFPAFYGDATTIGFAVNFQWQLL